MYGEINDFFKDLDVNKITRLVVKEYIATLNIQDKTKKDYLWWKLHLILELAKDNRRDLYMIVILIIAKFILQGIHL